MNQDIKYLTNEELKKLFKCIDVSNSRYAMRDRALIKLAYYGALRVSEVSSLKLSDFNKESREIRCNRIQNGKNNVLKIVDDDIYNDVCRYYDSRMYDQYSSEYFFVSQLNKCLSRVTIHSIINMYCEQADISVEKRHFQVLRYTRAMDLLDMGFNLDYLIWWVGLSNALTSKIYQLYLYKNGLFFSPEEMSLSQKNLEKDAYSILERGKDAKSQNKKSKKIKLDD